jgi:hypothetical protein
LLNPNQVETTNVLPGDSSFARVVDPSAINTSTWSSTYSIHGTALESPLLPGYPDYAVKLYNDPSLGNVIAVVHPTYTFTHYVDAALYTLGWPVNARIAISFLNSNPPPPPPPQPPGRG